MLYPIHPLLLDDTALRKLLQGLISVLFPEILPVPAAHSEDLALLLTRFMAAAQGDSNDSAETQAAAFLQQLPAIRPALDADLEAAFQGDPAAVSREEVLLCSPGFRAVLLYRIAHGMYTHGIPLLPRMISEAAHRHTGIDIHPGAEIGAGCFIDHGTGVVIGETAQLGQHVRLYQGVTLGAKTTRGGQALRGTKRHPTLGDSVTVYAGASVLGGDTHIGNGAVIGAGGFVISSIPAGEKVRGR